MSFFAAPPTVETTVFTRLPDRFRDPRPTAWANANRQGRAIDSFSKAHHSIVKAAFT